MEDFEDLFLISNFRIKIYGTFELHFWIMIFNWHSNFKMISELWNTVYFVLKPDELAGFLLAKLNTDLRRSFLPFYCFIPDLTYYITFCVTNFYCYEFVVVIPFRSCPSPSYKNQRKRFYSTQQHNITYSV